MILDELSRDSAERDTRKLHLPTASVRMGGVAKERRGMNIYYTASLYEILQKTAQVINGNGVNLNEMDG